MLEGNTGASRSESHESSGESKVVAEEVDDQEEIIEVVIDQLGPINLLCGGG